MSSSDQSSGQDSATVGKVIEWKHHKLPRPMEILSLELKIYEPFMISLELEKCLYAKEERDKAEAHYKEAKEELAQIQLAEGLDGLRHNNIVFRCREVMGKTSYPVEKIMTGMLMEGLKPDAINRILDFARKEGANYFVKEIGTE